MKSGKGLFGDMILDVVSKVVVINEVNVVMGIICVILIVGFVGIVLGVLFVLREKL